MCRGVMSAESGGAAPSRRGPGATGSSQRKGKAEAVQITRPLRQQGRTFRSQAIPAGIEPVPAGAESPRVGRRDGSRAGGWRDGRAWVAVRSGQRDGRFGPPGRAGQRTAAEERHEKEQPEEAQESKESQGAHEHGCGWRGSPAARMVPGPPASRVWFQPSPGATLPRR